MKDISNMKLFLDTNILIDLIGGRGRDGELAKRLLVAQAFGDISLVVSAKSYTDVFYVLKRYADPFELQQQLLDSAEVCIVCSIDTEDIISACKQQLSDFEDALIIVAAEKIGADFIITRDKAFQVSKIPTLSPKAFFDLLQEKGVVYKIVDAQ